MRKIHLTAALALLAIGGCSTVTINPEVSGKLTSAPSYEQRKAFYWWGLSGEHRINVKEVCADKGVAQMQTQQTFEDGLLGVITLGIYAPHTAKVWCK